MLFRSARGTGQDHSPGERDGPAHRHQRRLQRHRLPAGRLLHAGQQGDPLSRRQPHKITRPQIGYHTNSNSETGNFFLAI